MQTLVLCTLLSMALLSLGCQGDDFSKPEQLGGATVAAMTLNQGHAVYRRYCVGCHGVHGDGKGPTSNSMTPPPRDFTAGSFKWSFVPGGKLPVDDDIIRTLRHGLNGTHMPAFAAMPDEDARAVVQYLKTFSPRWRSERPGNPVVVPPDPWRSGRLVEAAKRGETVYHVTAQCWACHPAYASRGRMQEMEQAVRRATGGKLRPLPFRADLRKSLAVATRHGKLLPPDFLSDTLRVAQEQSDLYRTVAAGIGGTPMPSWQSELSSAELWAVVHYLDELRRIKGTRQAEVLEERAGH